MKNEILLDIISVDVVALSFLAHRQQETGL